MTHPYDIRSEPAPFDDEDTDGAARFEQATRAARDLTEMITDQTALASAAAPTVADAPAAVDSTAATPLQPLRVVFLIGVMVAVWFGFMLWDTWGG